MAKRYLIIDGYNFLHAAGLIPQPIGPQSLEKARQRLFRLLRTRLAEAEQERTTIVFDANDSFRAIPREQNVGLLKVLNAVDYPDADSLIEELVEQHPVPKQLLLVSGDRRLQKAARRRKAMFTDGEWFYDQLKSRTVRKNPSRRAPPTPLPELTPDLFRDLTIVESSEGESSSETLFWKQRIQELTEPDNDRDQSSGS